MASKTNPNSPAPMDYPFPVTRQPSPLTRGISYLLAAVALLLVIRLRLLPALLVYELVRTLTPLLGRRISGDRARVVVVAVLGAAVVGLLLGLIFATIAFFRSELGSSDLLWREQLMPLVEKARQQLPALLVDNLPDSVDDLRVGVMELLRRHASTLQLAGRDTARAFVHIII